MSKPSSFILALVLLSFTAAGCAEQKGRKKDDNKAQKKNQNKSGNKDGAKKDNKATDKK